MHVFMKHYLSIYTELQSASLVIQMNVNDLDGCQIKTNTIQVHLNGAAVYSYG